MRESVQKCLSTVLCKTMQNRTLVGQEHPSPTAAPRGEDQGSLPVPHFVVHPLGGRSYMSPADLLSASGN